MDIRDLDLSEDNIRNELRIDSTSVFSIEKELAEHSGKEGAYVKYASIANKQVDQLELQLEVIIATIVDELCKNAEEKKKPIPPSAIGELRKSKVPLDKRYQKIKTKLADAHETAYLLNGLVRSWNGRGFRLDRISKMNERDVYNQNTYFNNEGE